MKVSKEKTAENRARILKEAARLFRERGTGIGVDALAEAAGLTHGSLYSQFGSKEGLMSESMADGYAKARTRGASIDNLGDSLALYLSAAHRDHPGTGCFMAALGCEMGRQSKDVRRTFTEIVRSNLMRIGEILSPRRKRQREDDAIAIVASMVGAMVLARSVDDKELSDRILSVNRARLLEKD